MENITNDQHTSAPTFSSTEENVTPTTQTVSNITSDVSISTHIITNTDTNNPLHACENHIQDDNLQHAKHSQPSRPLISTNSTKWKELRENADSKTTFTPTSRCFSGIITPHKPNQPNDEHLLKRSMDKSELSFSSAINQHESTFNNTETININIESMVGFLRLHGDFHSIIIPQISAVRRHFATAFEACNQNKHDLHSLRILYDEELKGFFFLLLPAFGKTPSAAMVNSLYTIANNLSNISTTQDMKLIEYLKKKIKIKSNHIEMPLPSEKETRNPTTKPQPSILTTSIILKSDNPKIYSFLTKSDFENIILKGLTSSYPELESLTISFTPRPTAITNLLDQNLERLFKLTYKMDMGKSTLLAPTEDNNDINFTVHLNDLPCVGDTHFSITICKSVISKNDMNENCPFCLTAHTFNESDFGESCPVFTQKKEESQSFKQCSHCQLGGHENHRNFNCIFNTNPSNIPYNRSIETESKFTVLEYLDAPNFNFSNGIMIPANSVALAFFNTKLLTKMSNTLLNLSDYIRFRNQTSQLNKQEFLNWLHTRNEDTVHTPPPRTIDNEWNWEENTHQNNLNANPIDAPSATPQFIIDSEFSSLSDITAHSSYITKPPIEFTSEFASKESMNTSVTSPKNAVDSEGFQLVKYSNRSTSQIRINQLNESDKSNLIELVNSCFSVDNTGRRNPNWSKAREKVFAAFPHVHRYASIESFKEAIYKMSNVSIDITKKSPIQNQLKKTPEQKNRFLSLTKATSFSESSTRTTNQQVVSSTTTSKPAVSSASTVDTLFQTPIQNTPISTKRPRETMGTTLSPTENPPGKKLAPPASSPVIIHNPPTTISVLGISKNFKSLEKNCNITASSYHTDSPHAQLTDIKDINIYFDAIKDTTDPVFTAIRMALLRLSSLSRDHSFTTNINLSLPLKVTVMIQNTHIYKSLTGHSIPADIISEKSINVIQSLIQLLKDSSILISFDIDSSSNSSTFTLLRDISIKAIENSSP